MIDAPIALMYHDVVQRGGEDESGFPGRDAALYKVTEELFDAHLRALASRAETAPDLSCRGRGPGPQVADPPERSALTDPPPSLAPSATAVVLTFDDGGVSALQAAERLERHGMRGMFFVTGRFIGTRGFLDRREIRDLHERGHVIGSHSWSHPQWMGHCSRQRLLDEWTRSRDVISAIVGRPIAFASVPGGDYAPAVAETAAEAGFDRLFTSEPTVRQRRQSGVTLQGRFTVQRWTSPATVAALANGRWAAARRQAILWNAKKLAKRLGGNQYLRVRQLLIGHGDEVAWGRWE